MLESWIRVIKPTTNDHVHDNVGHTRRNQLSHVKRTTLLLSHFVDHLFHFHQDRRLHDTLTESEPLQDRQTQLTMATKLVVIVGYHKSLKQQHKFRASYTLRCRDTQRMLLAERLGKTGLENATCEIEFL